MEIRGLTVGPVQENSYVLRKDGSDRALMVDPGDEPERLLGVLEDMGATLEAILLTHCHFDHIGAVAPVAKATGAPVYCPVIETDLLIDPMKYIRWAGIGPYEGHTPEHTIAGGERLELAGLGIDVVFTPGHSPGHVTFAITEEEPTVLFSGDVLFQASVGRADLPGGDHATLMASIADLLRRYPDEARVLPGHMGITTLGAERRTNPFLSALPA